MFETYTETARKSVFIGLYEAGQFGSETIETEHLLLGLLRADLPLAIRVFKSPKKLEEVRERIENALPRKEQTVLTSVNLPLSAQSERVLNFAAEQANRFRQPYVGAEHLLLGIAHEETTVAARIILDSGITFSQLEEEAGHTRRNVLPSVPTATNDELRDLVAEAEEGKLNPLVGRERELEQLIRTLSRKTKNNAILIGEPGVGKDSIVCGLAQRIAQGALPDFSDRQLLVIDASDLLRSFWVSRLAGSSHISLQEKLSEIAGYGNPMLYIRGLFDLRHGMPALAPWLAKGRLQLIATGTPLSFRLALERNDELARSFELVSVLPPTEEEALEIVSGVKQDFEKFHGVTLSPEAMQTAVLAAARFLRHLPLPERVIDLVDEASASVKVRREAEPPEIRQLHRQQRLLARRAEHAILNHNFEEARKLSGEEREICSTLARLREEFLQVEPSDPVSPAAILEVVAARTSLTLAAVEAALLHPPPLDARTEMRNQLTARIPVGRRDWVDGLLSYLTDCSSEDADHLSQAIRTARKAFAQSA